MNMKSLWLVLLPLIFIVGARGQPILTSSATSGFVCKGDHLSFVCRGNGNGLVWTYKSDSRSYPSNDAVQAFSDPSIYVVLLESGNNMIVSELIFLNVSDDSSVLVECVVNGRHSSSNITVIGGVTAPSINHTLDGRSVTVVLDHGQPDQIERFEIFLNGERHITVHNRQLQALLLLPECRTYSIHTVAVDICSNSNASDVVSVRCTSSPNIDPTETEPPSPDARCVSAIHTVLGLSTAILALVLLVVILFCGILIPAIIYICKKLNKHGKSDVQEKEKYKQSPSSSSAKEDVETSC